MAQYKLADGEKFIAMSMGMRDAESIQQRMNRETGEVKVGPTGKPSYASGVVAIRADGSGQDRGVTIAVEEYRAYPMGTTLHTDGITVITPYVADGGRQGLSVLCERLVPVNASPAKGDA
ncbi:hypothetical protein [Arthrobacter sp. 3Tela_A]|uniref:hypothetical protein n=1 Tax=Arthrobacter sp. 3Tela_A TaxID=3093743 RepID=UPI003BB76821